MPSTPSSVMKIFFDFQIFSLQTFGGISRYYYELINNFSKEKDLKADLLVYLSNNVYIHRSNIIPSHAFLPNTNLIGKHIIMGYINKILCIQKIKKHDYDVFHPTYYDPYFLSYINKKPFVLTIHDMIHERYKEIRTIEKNISEYKKLLANKASKIIAISENTKQDIIKYFDVDEKKIDVVYLGNSITPKSLPENNISVPKKYILYVGVRSFYKNFIPFLSSIIPSLIKDEELYLLCAGGGGFADNEISLFQKFGVRHKVFHHPISDDFLGHLYQNARVFVFPSLYEGFGIPVLEAFACGCPAVLSNASSLPEIAKEAALYFNPYDESSIRETVEKVLSDENIRKELIGKGLERVKDFSWEKTARETKKIYESLL